MMHSRGGWLGVLTDSFLLALLLVLLPCILASPTSPFPPASTSDVTGQPGANNGANMNETAAIEKRQMSVGTSCDSEGQWNCLTNQWQRCASGQWSAVMDCAAGTICTPSGLTNDFFVSFANGAAGGPAPATSGSTRRREAKNTHRMFLAVLGGVSTIFSLFAP
ncbi:hypothetical protein F4776DRAFT_121660 [Hypoxylon sp. NC0597]|nr:hypothetical protein F4776DRAFT_121660 [Hypoxylon sp. NC0597]